jgi:hypothetical protein
VREKQQLKIVEAMDRRAFVGGDPGDGRVNIKSAGKVGSLWQWGDEVAPICSAVNKYGKEVDFET